MQVTDSIKQKLGSFWPLFLPFVESPAWDAIFSKLKMEVASKRIVIPKSSDTFRSFEYVNREKLKAIIVLLDPYPTFSKDGIMIASGVPMSCENTGVLQPSLEKFYGGIENSYLGFEVSAL